MKTLGEIVTSQENGGQPGASQDPSESTPPKPLPDAPFFDVSKDDKKTY